MNERLRRIHLASCPKTKKLDVPLYAGKTKSGIVAPRGALVVALVAITLPSALLVGAALDHLEAQVSTLQEHIVTRDAEIDALRAQVASLQRQLSALQARFQRLKYTWLFKGAYALYEGEAVGTVIALPGMTPRPELFKLVVRLEVLEYNGTHAKLFFSYQEGSTAREEIVGYNGDWVAPGEESKIMESALTKLNETYVFVEGLGVRYCDVYGIAPGVRYVAYLDREFGWPIKLELSQRFHVEYDVELDLVKTNILGLKEA